MRKLLVLLLLCPFLSMCQPLSLQGKIVTKEGDPIAGATITIKRSGADGRHPELVSGPSQITNAKGEFNATGLHLGDTLHITAIGFESYSVVFDLALTRHPQLTIILERAAATLDVVTVNTGYQTLPRERATGSFETVGREILARQSGPNILARLQGTTSIQFDQNPLRPPLTMRGPSSILGAKDPLIILDNFPYTGDIANINPADIESVTLLKDAAAASVWGAKAGNGVIVITTRKGSNRPLRVEYASSLDITGRPLLAAWQTASAADFIDAERFLFSKGFRFADTLNLQQPAFSPVYEILFRQRAGHMSAEEAEAALAALRGVDVRRELGNHLYSPAFNHGHTLSLRGGSATVSYYFSAGFNNRIDHLDGTARRITLRTDNSFRLSPALRFTAALTYTGTASASGRPSLEQLKPFLYPYTRLAGEGGEPLPITRSLRQSYIDTAGGSRLLPWTYYPLLDWKQNTMATSGANLLAAFGLQYTLWKNLTLDIRYHYQQQEVGNKSLHAEESYFTRDLVNRFTQVNRATGAISYPVPLGAIIDRGLTTTTAHNGRAQLGYNRTGPLATLSLLAGAEWRQTCSDGATWRAYGYNPEVLTSTAVDYTTAYPDYRTGSPAYIPDNTSFSGTLDRFASFYANGAFTWRSRYTVSGSARRDASNVFGVSTNNRWRPLWSAGAAWLLSAEPFYKMVTLRLLRLRLTYGSSGNIDQSRSAVTVISYGVNAAGTNLPSAIVQQFPDPSLRWEKVSTLNLALDFALRGDRLSGTIEYFRKRGTDLFGNSPVDYTAVAVRSLTRNVADMKGSGLELSLNSTNLAGRFGWTTNLLFNYNSAEVTRYYPASTRGFDHISNGTRITAIEGYPVYAVLSFAWAGLDSAGNPVGIVAKAPTTNYSSIVGAATQLSDLVYSGPATPRFFGSLSNSFSFRGFTLTASLLYKLGYYFRRESVSYDLLFNQRQAHADFSRRWQAPGDEARTTVPSMIYPNNTARDAFYGASEVLVSRADNIRLQFVNLSYGWQNKGSRLSWIEGYRLSLIASDLGIIWRAAGNGIDPDYGTALPPAKTFSLTLSATFK